MNMMAISPRNRIRVTRAQALPDNFLLPDDGSVCIKNDFTRRM